MPYTSPAPLTRDRLATSSQAGRPIIVYLVGIEYAGRVWRWSTRAVDVSTADGESYSYGGGLDAVTVERAVAALQDSPELLTVPVELDWPGIAALIGAGHDLTAATGELSMHIVGEDYEQRAILVTGPVSQPEYGYDGTKVALTIMEAPFLDRGLWPPDDARVTVTTWPSAPEDSIGLWYPTVFGQPGVYTASDGSSLEVPGSPAIVVNYDTTNKAQTLLVNSGPVEATTATLWYDGATVACVIESATDGLGRSVSVVDTSGLDEVVRLSVAFFIIWDGDGATVDDRTGDAITGAGALSRWWLDRSTVRVDEGRWAALQRPLDTYRICGYVDEQVTPWEWVQDNLIPVLPVSMVASTQGIAPILWRWNAGVIDAVETIRAGAGTVLQGRVAYDASPWDLVSEVRVSWAYDADDGSMRRTTTCKPQADVSDPEQHSSVLAATSAQRAGGGQVQQIQSDWLQDAATAYLVAVTTVAVQGYSSRTATYECPQDVAWVSPGDVVRLVDDGLSIDGVALVTSWEYLDTGRVLLGLTIPGQPLRDTRTTGPDPTDGTFDDPGGT